MHAAPRASLPQSKTHAKALLNPKSKAEPERSGAALLAHFYTAELAANVTRIFARDLLAFGYPPWQGPSAAPLPVTADSIRGWERERFRPAFVDASAVPDLISRGLSGSLRSLETA